MKILSIALVGVGLLCSGSAFADNYHFEKNVRSVVPSYPKPEGNGHVDVSSYASPKGEQLFLSNKADDDKQDWATALVQANEGIPNPAGITR